MDAAAAAAASGAGGEGTVRILPFVAMQRYERYWTWRGRPDDHSKNRARLVRNFFVLRAPPGSPAAEQGSAARLGDAIFDVAGGLYISPVVQEDGDHPDLGEEGTPAPSWMRSALAGAGIRDPDWPRPNAGAAGRGCLACSPPRANIDLRLVEFQEEINAPRRRRQWGWRPVHDDEDNAYAPWVEATEQQVGAAVVLGPRHAEARAGTGHPDLISQLRAPELRLSKQAALRWAPYLERGDGRPPAGPVVAAGWSLPDRPRDPKGLLGASRPSAGSLLLAAARAAGGTSAAVDAAVAMGMADEAAAASTPAPARDLLVAFEGLQPGVAWTARPATARLLFPSELARADSAGAPTEGVPVPPATVRYEARFASQRLAGYDPEQELHARGATGEAQRLLRRIVGWFDSALGVAVSHGGKTKTRPATMAVIAEEVLRGFGTEFWAGEPPSYDPSRESVASYGVVLAWTAVGRMVDGGGMGQARGDSFAWLLAARAADALVFAPTPGAGDTSTAHRLSFSVALLAAFVLVVVAETDDVMLAESFERRALTSDDRVVVRQVARLRVAWDAVRDGVVELEPAQRRGLEPYLREVVLAAVERLHAATVREAPEVAKVVAPLVRTFVHVGDDHGAADEQERVWDEFAAARAVPRPPIVDLGGGRVRLVLGGGAGRK